MNIVHEMKYRAGLLGFGTMDDVPYWYCPCGEWRLNAVIDHRSSTGNNKAKATREFKTHLELVAQGGNHDG